MLESNITSTVQGTGDPVPVDSNLHPRLDHITEKVIMFILNLLVK